MLFKAGYNLRRSSFFKYIAYTLVFGIVGTFVSFGIIAPLTWIFDYFNLSQVAKADGSGYRNLNLSIDEILLFSSVISATDTVAALTFIKESSEPKLFSILFGEGVFNDAVSLVLFNIIRNFSKSKQGKLILDYYSIYCKNSFIYTD